MAGNTHLTPSSLGRWAMLAATIPVAGCLEHRELPEHHASACSGCHGDPGRPASGIDGPADTLLRAAPPFDVQGHSTPSARKVGAHVAHIIKTSTHAAIDCDRCHAGVDTSVTSNAVAQYYYESSHIDGATKLFGNGFVAVNSTTPSFSDTELTCSASWCHGPSSPSSSVSPAWNRGSGLDCTGCHAMPPPSPHPQLDRCATCHGEVVGGADGRTIVNAALHVDGHVNVVGSLSCNGGCHGSANSAAPPVDLSGATSPTSPGVGAHQAHLNTTIGRQVQCNDCHQVPISVDAPGHIDSTPGAEIVFSSLASAASQPARWTGASCANVNCHNPTSSAQPDTGASVPEPQWTSQGQIVCGSCHGLPPPAPHPSVTACNGCHSNMTSSMGFIDVTKHINGTVDF